MDRAWRLLDDGAGEPIYNMAWDETLLAFAAERPTLRLYAWSRPAVSLGRFQAEAADALPAALRSCERVRRATGGGAILHRDEITFALAAPLAHLGGEGAGVLASFLAVNRALARGLASLGVRLDDGGGRGGAPEGSGEAAVATGGAAPFLCFARASRTDLRVLGRKLVGSAQRRSGRAALQHGSIPLGLAGEVEGARRPATLAGAAGRPVGYEEAAAALVRGVEEELGARLVPGGRTEEERAHAARLERERREGEPALAAAALEGSAS
jgi:lipoate-protein ligase A